MSLSRSKQEIRTSVLFLWLSAGLLTVAGQPAAAQRDSGYQITDDRIVVETPAHWRNWTLPTHAVEVTSEGSVTPRRFRERYNILDDRQTFVRRLAELKPKKNETFILNIDSVETLDVRGNVITQKQGGKVVPVNTYLVRMGISRAGSNPAAAANILDGDPSTYWEPNSADPLDDWWVEVDLGRVVPVDSLVVRFVEAGVGDPFRQFRVLAAPNQVPIMENARKVDFSLVGRTSAPNREQRLFSFALEQPWASPEWTGRMVETLRLVVSATKGGRGRRISEAEWEALDPSERGEIVYFVKALQGFEEPEEREVYESLPLERRGRREHYIRERPRLADIEVWGYGDNISLGIQEGGGNIFLSGGGFSPGAGFDGDFSTNFVHTVREKTAIVDRGMLTVDMGATFWLDAMRVSSTSTSANGYIVRSSDGTLDVSGQPKWRRLSRQEREDNSVTRFRHLLDLYDSPRKLRFLDMITFNLDVFGIYYQGPEVVEYQLFSKGYPAEVVLVSDLVELPPGRNLGRIHWEGETPSQTQLEIRTRSGDLRRRVIRHFDKSGSEITQKQWNNLMGSFKGPVDTSFAVGSDWSIWSRSYRVPGERVTSPSQKAFLQFQIKLRTEDRFSAASIRALDLELLEPVAERLVGELWPLEVAAPGRLDTFEVFVRSLFVESPVSLRSAGFDELLLTLSGGSHMELLELVVGVDEPAGRPAQVFRPAADGEFTSASGQRLDLFRTQADSLWVRLPAPVHTLPPEESFRVYHRITAEGDQVPVGRDGQRLTLASYGLLEAGERGDSRYFRRQVDASGQVQLTPVNEATYDELAEEARQARYFRLLMEEGGQFSFDTRGDSLDESAYNALPADTRGRIAAPGPLLRLRFAAPIFVNGTTLDLAVRHTAGGAELSAPWQGIEAGDATSLVTGDRLSIQVPLSAPPLDDFTLVPNPFTPNGDGINDETQIRFSIFKLGAKREATVRIYALDGRRVWERRQQVGSGPVTLGWSGTDQWGRMVPPGIYLCQVSLDIDAEKAGSSSLVRLIHLAY